MNTESNTALLISDDRFSYELWLSEKILKQKLFKTWNIIITLDKHLIWTNFVLEEPSMVDYINMSQ